MNCFATVVYVENNKGEQVEDCGKSVILGYTFFWSALGMLSLYTNVTSGERFWRSASCFRFMR